MALSTIDKNDIFASLSVDTGGAVVYRSIIPQPDHTSAPDLPTSYFDDLSVIVALAKRVGPENLLELACSEILMAPELSLNFGGCRIFTNIDRRIVSQGPVDDYIIDYSGMAHSAGQQYSMSKDNYLVGLFDIVISECHDHPSFDALSIDTMHRLINKANDIAVIIWRGCNYEAIYKWHKTLGTTKSLSNLTYVTGTSLCLYYPNRTT